MSARDLQPFRVWLPVGLVSGPSVVARLNESGGSVAAHLDQDVIVIRPNRQPTLAGMPAYYTGRPEYRGRLDHDGGGVVTLSGAVHHSGIPLLVSLVGGFMASLGALLGSMIIISGDVTGAVVIVGFVVIGTMVTLGGFLFRRLSAMDEQAILAVLRSMSDEPEAPSDGSPAATR